MGEPKIRAWGKLGGRRKLVSKPWGKVQRLCVVEGTGKRMVLGGRNVEDRMMKS